MKAWIVLPVIVVITSLCVPVPASGQTEGAAMVVIYPQDTVVMPVKTALLVCVAYGDPQSSVTWSKGTVSLSDSSQTSIWQQLLNQSGFVFVRSVLEICNTNAAHSGEYSCTADNGVGSHSISFQLTIQGAAMVVIYPQDTVVMPGKTALLVCVAYGDPQSSVTWSKGTVSLSNSSQISIWQQLQNQSGFIFVQSVLEICNTDAAHSGEYSCTADNGIGSHSISFQLTIQDPAQIVIRPNQTTTVDAGSTVTFVCVASGDPNPSISWNRGDTVLNNDSRVTIYEDLVTENGVTFVQSILELCSTEKADAGQYSCYADNTFGNDTASFVLTVNARSPSQVVLSPGNLTVDAGSTVLLACVGFGVPIPSVSWSTESVHLSNGSRINIYEELVTENEANFVQSILEICSAEEADGGQYTCTVGNALNNASANFELTVTATGDRAQIVIHPNQTTAVDAGNAIIFVCMAYGDPNPSISWNRGATVLNNDSRIIFYEELVINSWVTFVQSILMLCSAQEADAGQYSCFAENMFGNDTASFMLTVNAQKLTVSLEEQFYEVGEVDTDRHLAVQICALTRGAENERFSTSFVTLSTASGTAIDGIDFVGTTETFQFSRFTNNVPQCACISILQDSVVEGREFFEVSLSTSDSRVQLAQNFSVATVIIADDDTVLVGFEMMNNTVAESSHVTIICLSQRGALQREITITVTTVDGTASGDSDYAPVSFNHDFSGTPFNQSDFNKWCFKVHVKDDSLAEGNETFSVLLKSNDTAVIFTISTVTVTILDNEFVSIGLENSSYNTSEDAGSVVVCAHVISGPKMGRVFTVDLTTQDGTAQSTGPRDYASISTQLGFDQDNQRQCVEVAIENDNDIEDTEVFFVFLMSPDGSVRITTDNATIQIADNSGFPSIRWINDSPRVDSNTISASLFIASNLESVTCELVGRRSNTNHSANCSSGFVSFTVNNRLQILDLTVTGTRPGGEVAIVLSRDLRIERLFCSLHLINDGVTVDGNTVTVEWQGTGPTAANRITRFDCRLGTEASVSCTSPYVHRGLLPGNYTLTVRPSQGQNCRRRFRRNINFTV